ncbi:hypothetical protein HYH02_010178 [Chlamydomonas schloesseri]|uniref:Ankyrin repeat domain-containing protein n=1 Tax=Chlamydomonas schloesseri TaxID=2026947 RepID=A0A835TCA6_9CHLO|nr:hypothetical protein HYH02_010178 [Chlamydomonas schloesseri]|eukprot:KAG2440598.1 hypothetical protein HYH02_010178 [Chlamydomonas schloesseri]
MPWPSVAFVAHWGRPQPWRALNLRQRRRCVSLAANSGCAASLEAALAHCGCCLSSEVAVAAVLGGSLAAVKTLLVREGCDCSGAPLEVVAAEAGHLPVLQWLLQARREQLLQDAEQWIIIGQPPAEITTAAAACRGGHAHILAWLQEQEQRQQQQQQQQPGPIAGGPIAIAHPRAVPFLAGAAAEGGHVGLLRQLLPRLEPIPTVATHSMLRKVAQGCPLEVLQCVYLHLYGECAEPGAGTKQSLAFAAAVSPTPDWEAKLGWVLQQQPNARMPGHPNPALSCADRDEDVIQHAAGALPDWLQRLQALSAHSVPLPPLDGLVSRAAAVGDVAALRWLLEERRGGREVAARMSEELMQEAAASGHVPVLAELRARGGVLGKAHVGLAAVEGRADAVRWLLQQQPLQPPVTEWRSVFVDLARRGADLELLRQLHERHGAPIDIDAVAQAGSVDALEWAVAALRQGAAACGSGQEPPPQQAPTHAVRQLLRHLQRRTAWLSAALHGNLAAADWAARLLADHGHEPPLAPRAGDSESMVAVFKGDTFGALRWWLRQRQEGHGLTQVVRGQGEGGEDEREERVGALTDMDWQVVLENVASSFFPPPAFPGHWAYSRAQWNWLVAKRLEAASGGGGGGGRHEAGAGAGHG